MLNDKNAGGNVRQDVAEALGNIGDASAVPVLIAALKDSDAWVRRNAVWALGEIGDERAIPTLIEALKDSDEWIARDAANTLGKIGAPALPALIAGLKHRQQQGHRYADALVKMGEPAVPAELMNDADEQVRRYAAWALRRIGRLTTDAVPTSRRMGPPEAKKAIEDYKKPR